jgi:DNA-binding LacI/PurR family transcriptional regulator
LIVPSDDHVAVAERQDRATLGSVAARAGVSRQTVSNVLNAPDLVRSDTAARVKRAIDELGYRPHRAAQQLRTRRSHLLGLRAERVPGAGVFDRFLHAVTDAVTALDYRVMLFTAVDDDDEIAQYTDLVGRWALDGFLLTSTHPGDRRTAHLARIGVPCVTFGRPWDDTEHHPWVDVDGAAGTRRATEHLIERGHRHIGFLGWPEGSAVGDDRLSGWRSALEDAELPTPAPGRCPNDVTEGRRAAAALLDRSAPTALVCVSDALALGAMAELSARGLRPGVDVAVVGFDDTDSAQTVGLSSIAQPLVGVAEACGRLLVGGLSGRSAGEVDGHVLLAPELIVRGSSAGPAPASPTSTGPTPSSPTPSSPTR